MQYNFIEYNITHHVFLLTQPPLSRPPPPPMALIFLLLNFGVDDGDANPKSLEATVVAHKIQLVIDIATLNIGILTDGTFSSFSS